MPSTESGTKGSRIKNQWSLPVKKAGQIMVRPICQDVISKGCDKGSDRDVPGISWGLNSAGRDFQKIFFYRKYCLN